MAKRRGKRAPPLYRCEEPPCIHVVVDERRKIFRVFIEDEYENNDTIVSTIPFQHLERACQALREALAKGFREATGDEIDYLAHKYLHVRPLEE